VRCPSCGMDSDKDTSTCGSCGANLHG
jgi:hypothetical protein